VWWEWKRRRESAFYRQNGRVGQRQVERGHKPYRMLHVWARMLLICNENENGWTDLDAGNYAHLCNSFLVIWMLISLAPEFLE